MQQANTCVVITVAKKSEYFLPATDSSVLAELHSSELCTVHRNSAQSFSLRASAVSFGD